MLLLFWREAAAATASAGQGGLPDYIWATGRMDMPPTPAAWFQRAEEKADEAVKPKKRRRRRKKPAVPAWGIMETAEVMAALADAPSEAEIALRERIAAAEIESARMAREWVVRYAEIMAEEWRRADEDMIALLLLAA